MAKVTCYTQRTTRGHELRRLRDDAFLRLATPDEIAASDDAAARDGGIGAFEADGDESAHGYTFAEWLAAAGRSDSASEYDLRAAWRAGEDPSEYAIGGAL